MEGKEFSQALEAQFAEYNDVKQIFFMELVREVKRQGLLFLFWYEFQYVEDGVYKSIMSQSNKHPGKECIAQGRVYPDRIETNYQLPLGHKYIKYHGHESE